MAKICPRCRGENDDFAVICINCGERIETETYQNSVLKNSIPNGKQDNYVPPEILLSKYSIEFDKSMLLLAILWIVILMLVVSTIFLPWYSMNSKISGNIDYIGSDIGFPSVYVEYTYRNDLKLSERESTVGGKSSYSMIGGSQWLSGSSEYNDNDALKEPLQNTLYLAIISTVLVIILIISLFIFCIRKFSKKIIFLLAIVVVIFLLVTLVYFTVSTPNGINKNYESNLGYSISILKVFNKDYDGSFFGSYHSSTPWSNLYGSSTGSATVDSTWGPSYSWFLLLVSLILSIVSLIITFTKIKNKK